LLLLPANTQAVFDNPLIAAAVPAAVIACSLWLTTVLLAHKPLTHWFEEEELKKIEAQMMRLQATRERLEQKSALK
jgi:hypothetical protein